MYSWNREHDWKKGLCFNNSPFRGPAKRLLSLRVLWMAFHILMAIVHHAQPLLSFPPTVFKGNQNPLKPCDKHTNEWKQFDEYEARCVHNTQPHTHTHNTYAQSHTQYTRTISHTHISHRNNEHTPVRATYSTTCRPLFNDKNIQLHYRTERFCVIGVDITFKAIV